MAQEINTPQEPVLNNPRSIYFFAFDSLKARYPAGESIILQDTYWAYEYARNVIKDRWPEAEIKIIKDPEIIYYYARNVIKARWLEAEPIIMKNNRWYTAYKKVFQTPLKIVEYHENLSKM